MKWKSEETLDAYQHYFDEQRHADSQEQFHTRLHAQVQQYLAEQHYSRLKKQTPSVLQDQCPSGSLARQFDDEPDLSFLYSLGGER
jgi:hypothetical protein